MNELLQSKIEDYLHGRMADEVVKQFEEQIATDRELASEVELFRLEKQALQLSQNNELRNQMKNWEQERNAEDETQEARVVPMKSSRNRLYRLSVAASFLLMFGLGASVWFANANYSNRALVSDNIGLTTSTRDRGNINSDNPFTPVFDAIESGNHTAALQMLEGLDGSQYESTAMFLKGEILTKQKRFEEAIALYSEMAQSQAGPAERQKAQWLLANTFLANDQADQAKAILKEIAGDTNHLRQEEAAQLLDQLESFWRIFAF
ncbi:MAG: hypothetical protein KI786_19215 [Mameliella sp.]|nr:hypothetical protein [Phaeodactylibacter sp.]